MSISKNFISYQNPFLGITGDEVVAQITQWSVGATSASFLTTQAQIDTVFSKTKSLFSETFSSWIKEQDQDDLQLRLSERFQGFSILPLGVQKVGDLAAKQIEFTHAVAMEILLTGIETGKEPKILIEGKKTAQILAALTRLATTRVGAAILLGAVQAEGSVKIGLGERSAFLGNFPGASEIFLSLNPVCQVRHDKQGVRSRWVKKGLEDQAGDLGHELLHFLRWQNRELQLALKNKAILDGVLKKYTNFEEFLTLAGHIFGYPSENMINLELGLLERYGHESVLFPIQMGQRRPFVEIQRSVRECVFFEIHKDVILLADVLLDLYTRVREERFLNLLRELAESVVWGKAFELGGFFFQEFAIHLLQIEGIEHLFLDGLDSSNVERRKNLLKNTCSSILLCDVFRAGQAVEKYTEILDKLKQVTAPTERAPASLLSLSFSPYSSSAEAISSQPLRLGVTVSASSSPVRPDQRARKRGAGGPSPEENFLYPPTSRKSAKRD